MGYTSILNANSCLIRMLFSSSRIACLCHKHDASLCWRRRDPFNTYISWYAFAQTNAGSRVGWHCFAQPLYTAAAKRNNGGDTGIADSGPCVNIPTASSLAESHSPPFYNIPYRNGTSSYAANHKEAFMRDVLPSTPCCGCRNVLRVALGT